MVLIFCDGDSLAVATSICEALLLILGFLARPDIHLEEGESMADGMNLISTKLEPGGPGTFEQA